MQQQYNDINLREYIVYKHECLLCQSTNGIYIGITCQDPDVRWRNGLGYLTTRSDGRYYQPAMANAILTYGWENFTHEILLEGLTEAEAKQKEKELIDFYDTYEHGLNCTRGGDGTARYKTAEEAEAARKLGVQNRLEKIYADPRLHEELKANQRIAHDKRKQDLEKHAKDLESCRQANIRRRADHTVREQLNASARKSYAKKRSTDEGLAQMREYAREYHREQMKDPEKQRLANERAVKARQKVTECRKALQAIFKTNPELFSAEDVGVIFDKKSSHNYKCMTFTILNEVLTRVQGELSA